jgi:chaperonin GroEL|tara:strand:- start:1941 stop:3509 length:1569 start_codon:yes stop_codon:yes gene_type:complete
MEFNQPSEIVKDLTFGTTAEKGLLEGVRKLSQAVSSTLGASGKCVIYEDALGRPVITKDGVTVAESVILSDPLENMGATLIKEAARNTVKEAGDGTTTATILAHELLTLAMRAREVASNREIRDGLDSGLAKVLAYLDDISIEVTEDKLYDVANISTNNDTVLGRIIGDAFSQVGRNGVVLMEESDTEETYSDIVDGTQFDSSLKSPYLITDKDKGRAILENPVVLIVSSPIPNVRKIQNILEYAIKNNEELLIVADLEQQPFQTLLMNKVKGNIKVNIIDPPGFGPTRQDTIADLAAITGAQVMNEELGDDLDMIDPSCLGRALKSVTDGKNTVITVQDTPQEALDRIEDVEKKVKDERNPYIKAKLEQRLGMLSGHVGIVRVGALSKVELKEKKDRVEDALYATKAALKNGIVPGGGVALLNAAQRISTKNVGEEVLIAAIESPFRIMLENAGLEQMTEKLPKGTGVNVMTGKVTNMIKAGVIDPVLVTKSALSNAVSVVKTIISADCVISNKRIENARG